MELDFKYTFKYTFYNKYHLVLKYNLLSTNNKIIILYY